jgi:hypothetical protein
MAPMWRALGIPSAVRRGHDDRRVSPVTAGGLSPGLAAPAREREGGPEAGLLKPAPTIEVELPASNVAIEAARATQPSFGGINSKCSEGPCAAAMRRSMRATSAGLSAATSVVSPGSAARS